MGFLNDLFIKTYDGSLKRLLRAVFASKVELNTKQDTINDLSTIRSGAAAGATAVQPSVMNTALVNTVAESGVYDVTVNNSGATFASLNALLSAQNLDTLIPVAKRKGGMSIKYVQSSDNKYVQFRLMATDFSTTESDWQGVDEEPTDGSDNLVKSGGTFNQLYENFGGYTELTPVQTYSNSYITNDGVIRTGGSDKVVAKYDVGGMTQVAVTGLSLNAPNAVLACAYNSSNTLLQYYYKQTGQKYDKVPIQLPANTKYLCIGYTTSYLGGAFSGYAPLSLLKSKFVIFDVSKYNKSNNTPVIYDNLSSAIAAIPEQIRVAGMLIKYIRSIHATYYVDRTDGLTAVPTGTLLNSDPAINDGIYVASQLTAFSNLPSNIGNKVTYYIQVTETSYTKWEITKSSADSSVYTAAKFLLSSNFNNSDFLAVINWQGIDEKPIEQSVNIPTSGGVASSLFDLKSEIAENIAIYNNVISLPANATSIALTLEKGYFYRFHIYRNDSSERLSIYTNTKSGYDAATIKIVGNLLSCESEKIFDFVTDRDSTYLYLMNKNASAISVHFEIVKNVLPKYIDNTVRREDVKQIPVSTNLLSTYTLGTGWSVNDGVFAHSGGNGAIEYDFHTISGKKYVLSLEFADGSNVESGLYAQLGSDANTLVDCYNGSNSMIIGFIGNGQSPKIITSQVLSITNIQFREVVSIENAISIIDYHPINVFASRGEDDITSYWNIAIGSAETLSHSQNSTRNIGLGFRSLENLVTGTRNIGLGTFALHKLIKGNRNVAIGADALWYPNYAQENVVIGYGAANAMNTGMVINENVIIGSRSLPANLSSVTDIVVIGFNAGTAGLSSIANSIVLGYNAKATKSNQCVIGNANVSEFILGNKKLIFNENGTVTWEPVS